MEEKNKTVQLKDPPKGEFFKFPGRPTVWIRDDYNRFSHRYMYYDAEDINRSGEKVGETIVEIGFTY